MEADGRMELRVSIKKTHGRISGGTLAELALAQPPLSHVEPIHCVSDLDNVAREL
jgi:hypothetical protein